MKPFPPHSPPPPPPQPHQFIAGIIFIKLQIAKNDFVKNLSTVIVILVASIPIAIEVVCTSTLAVGSRRLAEKKIIVARLSAIEELAGMTILCSDKTGTLTLNQLSLREPVLMGEMTADELKLYACVVRLTAPRTFHFQINSTLAAPPSRPPPCP